jgi:outer membrane receptor protein involved in Fe transport
MGKRFLTFIIAAFSSMQLFSQTIEGIIINAENKYPVADVNIAVKNSAIGTVSERNGLFSLETKNEENYTIQISCIGFESKEINIKTQRNSEKIEIQLQPVTIQLNKSIVVTATKKEQVSFATPDTLSVLTETELKNNSPRSTAEALIGVAGVWMQKTTHGAGSPIIRGLTGNQTLLLIDGIRLNNGTFRYGPNQYFNTLDVFAIERIEVIRGKGSVLFGSDAIGGVINTITRSPEYFTGKPKFGGRGKLKYMNNEMEQSAAGELSFQSKNIAILGNVTYKNFGDIFAGGDLGFERPSGYSETGVNLKAKMRFGSNWQITPAIQHLNQNDVPRYDQVAQRGYQTYLYDPQVHQLVYAKAEHFSENPFFRRISFTVSNQLSDETIKIKKEISAIFQQETDVVKTNGINIEFNSELSKNWEAVTGAEFYSDHVESGKTETNNETGEIAQKRGLYPDDSEMKNFALFSQHNYTLNQFRFNFGGRFNVFKIHTVDEEFGEVTLKPNSLVGNINIQYFTSEKQQFIVSAYSAFRAPNINDISTFGNFDYGIEIPSTDLSPEKSVTFEAGYKKSAEILSLSLFAYNTRLNDQIERVESTYNGSDYIDGEKVYKKENISKSNISGIEFESGIKIDPHFSFINNITWTYGKNLENDEPMRRIPPLNGKLALQYSNSKFFAETEYLFAAKQERLSQGDIDYHRIPKGGTPGWNIVNLKVGYSWKIISLNAGLQNIFNQAYRLHGSGIDGFGRSFWMTIQFEI